MTPGFEDSRFQPHNMGFWTDAVINDLKLEQVTFRGIVLAVESGGKREGREKAKAGIRCHRILYCSHA